MSAGDRVVLRDYQEDVVQQARQALRRLSGPRRVLIQADTGAGKSVLVLEPIRSCYEMGKRALFLARGRELVHQFSKHLTNWGLPHGLVMRGEPLTDEPIQVASKDTLQSWALKRERIQLPPADLLVVDECHCSLSPWWRRLIEAYPRAVVLGLTATPARTDGRGLGDLYGAMVMAIPPTELIRRGFLVPTRVFAPYRPNLQGVPVQGGDFVRKELRALMDRPQLVGDIVGHWRRLAQGRPTIVYATGVGHSLHLKDEFLRAGILAGQVDGKTDPHERDDLLAALGEGRLPVLCNVGVLVQGVDVPNVSCAVLACPTKSYVKFRQAAGRIKRPYPGKDQALLLDHAGCVYLHGLPDEDVEWTLEPTQRVQDRQEKKRQERPEKGPVTCPACHAVFAGAPQCPECGHVFQKQPKVRVVLQGRLVPLTGGTVVRVGPEEAQRYWDYCLRAMFFKDRTTGAASRMFRARFGIWPPPDLKPMPHGEQWRQRVQKVFPDLLDPQASGVTPGTP